MVSLCVLVCSMLLGLASTTNVEQCPGKSFQDLNNNVHLTCKKTPCKLKKGHNQQITVTFTPETEVKDLINRVSAEVFGVPLPFVGVDGNSVCNKLQTESGEKAGCPLQAGTKYVYKDQFPVLTIYPSINVRVHWSLQNNGKDITCFEFPARIE